MAPRYPELVRNQGPWPISDELTTKVCRYAGREASIALWIALGRKAGANAAREAAYHEPFTYWDWHGVFPDPSSIGAPEQKRQRMWEYQRGFSKFSEGRRDLFGYPPSRQRWHMFQEAIRKNPSSQSWVKRIAMAHWMTSEDLQWIAENLPRLHGLDLSDTPFNTGGSPTEASQSPPSNEAESIQMITDLKDNPALKTLFLRLTWLGIPDFRSPEGDPQFIVNTILPKCENLRTLSIRGEYSGEANLNSVEAHGYVCHFIASIVTYAPDSVITLELRLTCSFLDRLVEHLTKHKPKIKRIGIDLGAWIQVYPLRTASDELKEKAIKKASVAAAKQLRFESYEEEHNKKLPMDSKWWLPPPIEPYYDGEALQYAVVDGRPLPRTPFWHEVRHDYKRNFYLDDGGSYSCNVGTRYVFRGHDRCPLDNEVNHRRSLLDYLDDTRVNTLPSMLYKLYDIGQALRKEKTVFFPLEPEWQLNSANPIHPLALIQRYPSEHVDIQRGQKYGQFQVAQLQYVYAWLNTTFGWRPLIDWDWFMKPESHNLDTAYQNLWEQRDLSTRSDEVAEDRGDKAGGSNNLLAALSPSPLAPTTISGDSQAPSALEVDHSPDRGERFPASLSPRRLDAAKGIEDSQENKLIVEIAKQLDYMRQGGIPIQLLIGRRHPDTSSLYWGWPYDKTAWEETLVKPFSANLELIAPLVDTLIVSYDLRNPLDGERLEDIDAQQAYYGPAATCPRFPCPLRATNNCPFAKQWVRDLPAASQQRMANRRGLKSAKAQVWLASNIASHPPTGEDADEHTSEDSDTDHAQSSATLHQLARRAAYDREAVGWQRFWAEYAPKLTNLTELHVRMPLSFDGVGSLRLAKLLNPKKGWKMAAFADERQHIQTREDVIQEPGMNWTLCSHAAETKVWPAGRFVRRTWVRMLPPSGTRTISLRREEEDVDAPTEEVTSADSNRTIMTEDKIERREQEELQKAIRRAEEAAQKEEELEKELKPARKRPPPVTDPDSELKDLESRLIGKYGWRIRRLAKQEWHQELQRHVDELRDREPEMTNLATSIPGADASDVAGVQSLLKNTRELLQRRSLRFRPEDVFRVHSESCVQMKNGVALVEHSRDYAKEEYERTRLPEVPGLFNLSGSSQTDPVLGQLLPEQLPGLDASRTESLSVPRNPASSPISGNIADPNSHVADILGGLQKLQHGMQPGTSSGSRNDEIQPPTEEKMPVENPVDVDSDDDDGFQSGLDSQRKEQTTLPACDQQDNSTQMEARRIAEEIRSSRMVGQEKNQVKDGEGLISDVQVVQTTHLEQTVRVEQTIVIKESVRSEQIIQNDQTTQVEQPPPPSDETMTAPEPPKKKRGRSEGKKAAKTPTKDPPSEQVEPSPPSPQPEKRPVRKTRAKTPTKQPELHPSDSEPTPLDNSDSESGPKTKRRKKKPGFSAVPYEPPATRETATTRGRGKAAGGDTETSREREVSEEISGSGGKATGGKGKGKKRVAKEIEQADPEATSPPLKKRTRRAKAEEEKQKAKEKEKGGE